MSKSVIEHEGVKKQREFAQSLEKSGFNFGLTVGEAFVRGIRDLGYKSTGTALDELKDNSIQAEATKILVAFGFGDKSEKKPESIAVIDDGHGMDPAMLRLAAIWGGTHREGSREGFGRYGYGLPSSCMSQGRAFTIYSKPKGGNWHSVTVDLDAIEAGKYTDGTGQIIVPPPAQTALPDWVTAHMQSVLDKDDLEHGTVVLIDRVDRLTWKTASSLQENLLRHMGITYRNYCRNTDFFVQGKKVEPIDPLFTTPGFRYYDLDEDRAEGLDPIVIDVKDQERKKVIGSLTVRFSYMPPTFGSINKEKAATGRNQNPRFQVMKDHVGIIFTRMGRQIDVVTKSPWLRFLTNDAYWSVEVDFPASLDEEFSINTSKQGVVASDRIWDLLEQNGVKATISAMRKKYENAAKALRVDRETDPKKKRASEGAMEDSEKFIRKKPETGARKERADKALEEEIKRKSRERNQPEEETKQQLALEYADRNYKVTRETLPGAPFFRVEQLGGTKVLFVNQAHRFFEDVYAGPHSNEAVRASLEVLLFVIGDCRLDATEDGLTFYDQEIGEWSRRLAVVLNQLSNQVSATSSESDEESEDEAA